jgi:hypothetical protein
LGFQNLEHVVGSIVFVRCYWCVLLGGILVFKVLPNTPEKRRFDVHDGEVSFLYEMVTKPWYSAWLGCMGESRACPGKDTMMLLPPTLTVWAVSHCIGAY